MLPPAMAACSTSFTSPEGGDLEELIPIARVPRSAVYRRGRQVPGRDPGSATDAGADVGGLRCVDHPDYVQLDGRRQDVEHPESLAQQQRDLVDLHLVQDPGLQRPLRRV